MPVSQPVSDRIVDNIVTTLDGIDGPNVSYFHTIRKVQKVTAGPADIGIYPYAEVAPGAANMDTHTGIYRVVQFFDIFVAHDQASTPAQTIEELIHDIVQALYVDQSRGDLAESTTIEGWEPDYPTDEADAITWAVIRVVVRYRTAEGDLTSSV